MPSRKRSRWRSSSRTTSASAVGAPSPSPGGAPPGACAAGACRAAATSRKIATCARGGGGDERGRGAGSGPPPKKTEKTKNGREQGNNTTKNRNKANEQPHNSRGSVLGGRSQVGTSVAGATRGLRRRADTPLPLRCQARWHADVSCHDWHATRTGAPGAHMARSREGVRGLTATAGSSGIGGVSLIDSEHLPGRSGVRRTVPQHTSRSSDTSHRGHPQTAPWPSVETRFEGNRWHDVVFQLQSST